VEHDIPPALLARFPELERVAEALRQFRDELPVTARCTKCGLQLEVVDVPETGALVVRCPTGDTMFRARRDKKAVDGTVP
jgi:hypothetical protein